MAAVWTARRTSEVPQISDPHGKLAPSGFWILRTPRKPVPAESLTGHGMGLSVSLSLDFHLVKGGQLNLPHWVVRIKWGNYMYWLIPCVVFSASSTSQQWWLTARCLQMSRPEEMWCHLNRGGYCGGILYFLFILFISHLYMLIRQKQLTFIEHWARGGYSVIYLTCIIPFSLRCLRQVLTCGQLL